LGGLPGFATLSLAPQPSLAPEVPGTAAAPTSGTADLVVRDRRHDHRRNSALLFFRPPACVGQLPAWRLLVLPLSYGAPQPAEYKSASARSLAINSSWLLS